MSIFISRILGKITMYQSMLWFLRGLLATAMIASFFGILSWNWWHLALNLLLFLILCLLWNLFFSKLYGVKANFESQYITAEILTLIVGPLNPLTDWWMIAIISFLAMGSKYVFAIKNRHIFNPAAFGVLISGLVISQGASWWIGNSFMLWFVVVGGFFMLLKLRWFHLAFSFLATYLLVLSGSLLAQGMPAETVLAAIRITLQNSAVIFFAVVMLIEPLTAPSGKIPRMVYGALIGAVMVLIPILWPTYGYSTETALLVGNLVMFIAVPKSPRQTLTLVSKTPEAKDTFSFWFQPAEPMPFKAGQFVEWTLPHAKPDGRGIRRFFTIASSPGQKQIRLVTKFNEKSSTFKQELQRLKPGDSIVISGRDGDFTLPNDPAEKVAFIAGGVGITPFLSILQDQIDKQQVRDMAIFYANKSPAEIGFQGLFSQAEKFGLKKPIILIDKPEAGWTGPTGFVTPELIQKELPDWRERIFYVSGPEPMVMAYEKMLTKMGLPADMQKHDYFPGYTA